MNTIATVVSARMGSTRLPGKALLDLGGVPIIQFLLERIRDTKLGGPVVLATTERSDDDVLAARVSSMGIPVFRGADMDVAGRYLSVARKLGVSWIVRITGDCPFVDAQSLDFCLSQLDRRSKIDLYTTKGVFPVGIDYEVLSVKLLAEEWPLMTDEEKEHLTLRFYRAGLGFVIKQFLPFTLRCKETHFYTIDTIDDYQKAVARVEALGNRNFAVQDLLKFQNV